MKQVPTLVTELKELEKLCANALPSPSLLATANASAHRQDLVSGFRVQHQDLGFSIHPGQHGIWDEVMETGERHIVAY